MHCSWRTSRLLRALQQRYCELASSLAVGVVLVSINEARHDIRVLLAQEVGGAIKLQTGSYATISRCAIRNSTVRDSACILVAASGLKVCLLSR